MLVYGRKWSGSSGLSLPAPVQDRESRARPNSSCTTTSPPSTQMLGCFPAGKATSVLRMAWPKETRTQVLILAQPLAGSDTVTTETELQAGCRSQLTVSKQLDSPAMLCCHCQQHPCSQVWMAASSCPSWRLQPDQTQTS